MDVRARVAEVEAWVSRMHEAGFRLELEQLMTASAMAIAAAAADESARRRERLDAIYGSWWWRLGGPVRRVSALRSRLRSAR